MSVIPVDFKTAEPSVQDFYERLEDALEKCPSGMPIATVVGIIEIFKANLIASYQMIDD